MAEIRDDPRWGDWRSVVTFGLVGLVGGRITAQLSHFSDWKATLLLTGVTALVASALGWVAPRVWRLSPIAMGLSVLAAGALNGALILFVLAFATFTSGSGDGGKWILLAPLIAALVGAVVALPFVPGLLSIARCHRRRRKARDGSWIGQAYDRALWRACALVIASGCAVALLDTRPPGHGLVVVAVVAGLVITLTAVLDLRDLIRIDRVARSMSRARPWPLAPEQLAEAQRDRLVTDLGLGERVVATVQDVAHVYREVERPRAILWGDHRQCHQALRRLAVGSVSMAAAALFVAWLSCLHRWDATFDCLTDEWAGRAAVVYRPEPDARSMTRTAELAATDSAGTVTAPSSPAATVPSTEP